MFCLNRHGKHLPKLLLLLFFIHYLQSSSFGPFRNYLVRFEGSVTNVITCPLWSHVNFDRQTTLLFFSDDLINKKYSLRSKRPQIFDVNINQYFLFAFEIDLSVSSFAAYSLKLTSRITFAARHTRSSRRPS